MNLHPIIITTLVATILLNSCAAPHKAQQATSPAPLGPRAVGGQLTDDCNGHDWKAASRESRMRYCRNFISRNSQVSMSASTMHDCIGRYYQIGLLPGVGQVINVVPASLG